MKLEEITHAIGFLDGLAMRLDAWAIQSRSGGWSTHQVQDNRRAADDCRREAAVLRNLEKRLEREQFF